MITQFEPMIKEAYATAVYDQIMSGWVGRYRENGITLCHAAILDTPWMTSIQTEKAAEIQSRFKEKGYSSLKLYRPAHHSFNPENREFPTAERVWKETLYLPSSINLDNNQIDEIAKTVLST